MVSLVLGRYAPALMAVITLGLGAGTFFMRRQAGDTALYNHAVAQGTSEAIDRYLARGGLRRLAAEDVKLRFAQAEKTRREREDYNHRTELAFGAGFRDFDSADEEAVDLKCIEALRARASTTHPKAVPALVRLVRLKRRSFDVSVWGGVVGREPGVLAKDAPDLGKELDAQGEIVEAAFQRVFAEICPASVLAVDRSNVWRDGVHLQIRATPVWLGKTWHLDEDGKPFEARQMSFEFHAQLVEDRDVIESFELTVAPAAEATMALRPQSLFTLPRDLPASKRVYSAMSARAYDRLYDELWSLFFAGDPRVPLVPSAVVTP
jgi:hypothetical protein